MRDEQRRGAESAAGRPRVVIVGSGFGGLEAARRLARAAVDVVLIDRRNHHLFQPLLYQVATAGLNPSDIASPIRSVLRRQRNLQVVLGEAVRVDRERRVVVLERGGEVAYDYLIVAAGMVNSYFGHDEWREPAPGLKSIEDALTIRRRILLAFEEAERAADPERIKPLLTFVVVGGGPTGVEMAGAIRDIAYQVMAQDFRRIDPRWARIVLVDGLPHVLAMFPEDLSKKAERKLERMGVELRLGQLASAIDEGGVQVGDERIESRTVIWAAGVRAAPLADTLGAEQDKLGRVRVEPDLTLPGCDRVFVIGDLARFEHGLDEPLPGLAPVAIQQGRHAAKSILRRIAGEPTEPFRYRDRGKMATIGRLAAVAEVGPLRFNGFLAWLAWLFVHLLFLVGFRNRLMVLVQWAYCYVAFRRVARLITEEPPRPEA